jgi:hypothetical protein
MRGHGHSGSVSYSTAEEDELGQGMMPDGEFRTPSRRGTYSRSELEAGATGIPLPSAIPVPAGRRQSGSSVASMAGGRRTSGNTRVLEDVGETY